MTTTTNHTEDLKGVFGFINTTADDKSGSLKKESGFRKMFPDIYRKFASTEFPEELSDLPFKQRLWHFLNDDYNTHRCKVCGAAVSFLTRRGRWGYSAYCSGSCAMKDGEVKGRLAATKTDRYGDPKYNNPEKQKRTLSGKDMSFWREHAEKSRVTRLEKNNGKYFSDETIEKIRETNMSRFGADSFTKTQKFKDIVRMKHDESQTKQHDTKKRNNSFNTSSVEKCFGDYLSGKGMSFISQYRDERYPFNCDFYLPEYDLYIEIQGSWTHGGHPFNPENPNDLEKLDLWRSKGTPYYDNAIYTWTDLDVRKRDMAEENHINRLEIFSSDITETIRIFEKSI